MKRNEKDLDILLGSETMCNMRINIIRAADNGNIYLETDKQATRDRSKSGIVY